MPYNPQTGKFERPTEKGAVREIGKGNQFAGCRDGESEAGCAKRRANWMRSNERRGGVKFFEMNTEQRKAFLAAGGKHSELTKGIGRYVAKQKAKQDEEPAPTGNGGGPRGGGPRPQPGPRYAQGGSDRQNAGTPGRSPSGLSREERQRIVAKRRLRSTMKPLGGR